VNSSGAPPPAVAVAWFLQKQSPKVHCDESCGQSKLGDKGTEWCIHHSPRGAIGFTLPIAPRKSGVLHPLCKSLQGTMTC